MTHEKDAEREEFEQNYRDRNEGSRLYCESEWRGWQAARRAPAAPVPQGWKMVPVEPTMEMVTAGDQKAVRVTWLHGKADAVPSVYHAMLAAAPQPPEVAPVQMPEPAGMVMEHEDVEWNRTSPPKRTKIYTEQQVRALLAAAYEHSQPMCGAATNSAERKP